MSGRDHRAERPSVTGSAHVLPFHLLDPATFERLCLWLVRAEGYEEVEHYGAAGTDAGRDIVAYRRDVGEPQRWYFQCKRRARSTATSLKLDADHIRELARSDPQQAPAGIVFMTSAQVSAKTRDEVRAHVGHLGFQCQFWAQTELDQRVKTYPHIMAEFFQLPAYRETRLPIPRRLPRAPLRFINRERELAALDELLHNAESAPGPVVAVLSGMHGVGKSAAGSQWTNQHRSRFMHGDLYGDLSKRRRGSAVDPSDVLADFLRDLGTADIAIPTSLAERRRLFERITADRRLLMLLDDVEEPAQVLSLLPTGAGSVVVVTSNYRLEEILSEGATAVPFDPLDDATAVTLLSQIAGVERIAAEPEAVMALVRQCAGLPIVLCVAAGRLAGDQSRSVEWLVDQVRTAPRTLRALSGSGAFAAQAVFEFAYLDLPPTAGLTYRRLGVHPGADLALPVVAVVSDIALAEANTALETLYEAHLIETPTPGRFRLHDLVRDHTMSCLEQDDDASVIDAAMRRLVDWYLAALRLADHAIVDDRLRLTDSLVLAAPWLPSFTSPADAFAWFGAERTNILSIISAAFDREWDDRVWQIVETLWPLCASHKLFSEWIESHLAAVTSARRLGDVAAEARFCSQLARAYAELGDVERAGTLMDEARVAASTCGNDQLRASVTEFGGVCLLHAGEAQAALEEFRHARELFVHAGNPRGVALQDLYSGSALVRLQQYTPALLPLGRALDVLTMSGDEISVGRVLVKRGEALVRLGRDSEARADLEQAISLMARLDIRFEQAEALETLAIAEDQARRPDVARAHRQRAYALYEDLGHPRAKELLAALADVPSA